MKEEEKISIEMLKSITFIDYQWYTDYKGEAINDTTMNKVIETVLKLIETQKSELEPIKKLNIPVKTLVAEWERLEDLEDNTDMLKAEIEKKDRIINAMTKVIIDSSICDYFIKQHCKHYAGENKKLCDECILEYFTKLVEGEKKDE